MLFELFLFLFFFCTLPEKIQVLWVHCVKFISCLFADFFYYSNCRQRDEPSKFVAIPCKMHKVRENSRKQVSIGFGFPSQWLIIGRKSFKPITKRSNRHRVITFDNHLKTSLD